MKLTEKQKQECNEDFDPRDMRASYNPAQELGKLGGQKTAKKYGKDYLREIGKKGANARWSKLRATP